MAYITGLRRNKTEWTPQFIVSIDEETCIGCGRCYKVCVHDVLAFEEVDEDDSAKMFMKVENPGNCIGCQACVVACTADAHARRMSVASSVRRVVDARNSMMFSLRRDRSKPRDAGQRAFQTRTASKASHRWRTSIATSSALKATCSSAGKT